MLQLTALASTTAADAADGPTNVLMLLAAGAFVVVLLWMTRAGELGNVLPAVGSLVTAVVAVLAISLVVFVVLVGVHAVLAV